MRGCLLLFSLSTLLLLFVTTASVRAAVAAAVIDDEVSTNVNSTLRDECGHTLRRPDGFIRRHFDWPFLKKFFRHWIPFTSRTRVKMQFYLYKRDFPDCGRELRTDDDESLACSAFDASHPTRVIIHGWMSQSKGSLNRAIKNAYLSLTTATNATDTLSDITPPVADPLEIPMLDDVNVIVVDWSMVSSNVNYFGVVDLIEDLGFLLAEFLRFLQLRASLHFGDVYLIGHSLGAQIAGSVGKQVQPFRINTIYALDPAGPQFRERSDDYRIDPSDAEYVESIQTSTSLGFQEPMGHATFYPNFGRDQKKCYIYGCSHKRAYNYFAESITSTLGFWGTMCQRESEDVWILSESGAEFRMGGEPSTHKHGTFYVRTRAQAPYALGRRHQEVEANSL